MVHFSPLCPVSFSFLWDAGLRRRNIPFVSLTVGKHFKVNRPFYFHFGWVPAIPSPQSESPWQLWGSSLFHWSFRWLGYFCCSLAGFPIFEKKIQFNSLSTCFYGSSRSRKNLLTFLLQAGRTFFHWQTF